MSRSPGKKDLPAVQCITKAIQDELHAINKYQRYMNDAEEPALRSFCHLMNEEKEHVAEFTAALFRLTHEIPAGRNRLTSAVSRPGPFQPQAHLRNAAGRALQESARPCGILRPGS